MPSMARAGLHAVSFNVANSSAYSASAAALADGFDDPKVRYWECNSGDRLTAGRLLPLAASA